ncbi:MAG: peptidoglycan binding domain-containing protein [Chloroflexi bacterium]|nr:peptidoglycan binding domain-containing protein [Chloroflexota bacterium]
METETGRLAFLGAALLATGMALGVVAAIVVGLVAGFEIAYAGRIYPGVRSMGVELGGYQPAEAQGVLEAWFAGYGQSRLLLRSGSHVWEASPQALGLRFDARQTVQAGYAVGHEGNWWGRLVGQAKALGDGHEVAPVLRVDRDRTSEALTKVNAEFRQPPVNALLDIRPDGTVVVVASRPGQEIILTQAVDQVAQALLKMSGGPIDLPLATLPVAVTEEMLLSSKQEAFRFIGRPVSLRDGDREWAWSPRELTRLLSLRQSAAGIAVSWDDQRLAAALSPIEAAIALSPIDARLRLDGTRVVFNAARAGRRLDVPATVAAFQAAIDTPSREVALVVRTVPPRLADADLETVRGQLAAVVSPPLVLVGDDAEWTVSPVELARLTRVVMPASPTERPRLEFDRRPLESFVGKLAPRLERKPVNARFRYQNGKIVMIQREQPGRQLDVAQTVDALLATAVTSHRRIPPVYALVPAAITAATQDQIVVKDKIMDATTSYAGSIPERAHNVELAAKRLDGTVIPPDTVFSFNAALGPATLKNGFKIGYGITLNGKGDIETVPSEAGGICQVATTLFHAVFWSGYPIVERNWHLYWIPRYGLPPRGLQGLDATVDEEYDVDFRFKNNTRNWVVIAARTDGANLTFELYGVKPDWEVKVEKPVITDPVQADPAPVRQEDPTMPPGRELLVEHAEDGFRAAIRRLVVRGAEVVDDWTARSIYRPSRNVTLFGPGLTPTPGPDAKGTPAATGTPGAASTPTAAQPTPTAPGTPARATPTPGR